MTLVRQCTAMLLFIALVVACSPDLSKSSAALLVPTDETYASQWQFEPIDGPDNYHFFVHWSPEFNPDVDRSLTLVGYQVSDLGRWTGEADAEDEATTAALATHAQRAFDLNQIDLRTCDSLDSIQGALVCEYDIGQPGPLVIVSRTLDTSTGTVALIVPGNAQRGLDYLRGEFAEMAPIDAGDLLR